MAVETSRGWRLDKLKASKKIDRITALTIGLSLAIAYQQETGGGESWLAWAKNRIAADERAAELKAH